MTVTVESRTIRLLGDCAADHCLEMAWGLHHQLKDAYRYPASVLDLGDWCAYIADHRTARKRAARADRLGYRFAEVERREFEDDVFAINTSTETRQGRAMSASYRERQTFAGNPLVCPHHHVYTYGVLRKGILYAYLWLYRCGQVALVSSILGHADRLRDDVMYLLATETVRRQTDLGGVAFYNMHNSGTDGLRFFKERLGFQPAGVEWLL